MRSPPTVDQHILVVDALRERLGLRDVFLRVRQVFLQRFSGRRVNRSLRSATVKQQEEQ
jgi:hypothetical protein